MAVEARRGCGYRKIGGLYLVSDPGGMPCDRLPIPLTVCPTCSCGIKQSRGFTWVDVFSLVGGDHELCDHRSDWCPICLPKKMGRAGLLWIGEKFYKTPDEFEKESYRLGVSRRIKALPRDFKIGETWILLAHPKTIVEECDNCDGCGWYEGGKALQTVCEQCDGKGVKITAGIFKVWCPQRLEKILAESQRGSEEHNALVEKGVTVVFFPDNDKDHQGSVFDKEEEPE